MIWGKSFTLLVKTRADSITHFKIYHNPWLTSLLLKLNFNVKNHFLLCLLESKLLKMFIVLEKKKWFWLLSKLSKTHMIKIDHNKPISWWLLIKSFKMNQVPDVDF